MEARISLQHEDVDATNQIMLYPGSQCPAFPIHDP